MLCSLYKAIICGRFRPCSPEPFRKQPWIYVVLICTLCMLAVVWSLVAVVPVATCIQQNTSFLALIAWAAATCDVGGAVSRDANFQVLPSCLSVLHYFDSWLNNSLPSPVVLFLPSVHVLFPICLSFPLLSPPALPPPPFLYPPPTPPLHSPPPSHLFCFPLLTGALWRWHLPSVSSCSCAHCAAMSHWHVGMPPMPPCWALNSATVQKRYSHQL